MRINNNKQNMKDKQCMWFNQNRLILQVKKTEKIQLRDYYESSRWHNSYPYQIYLIRKTKKFFNLQHK